MAAPICDCACDNVTPSRSLAVTQSHRDPRRSSRVFPGDGMTSFWPNESSDSAIMTGIHRSGASPGNVPSKVFAITPTIV